MMKTLLPASLVLISSLCLGQSRTGSTCSVVGWDSLTGDLGIVVESSMPAIGAIVPSAQAGAGAVAVQGELNGPLGAEALARLARGMMARQAVESIVGADSSLTGLQIGIVDAQGNAYGVTGSGCPGYSGSVLGSGYLVQATAVSGDAVVRAAARIFEVTPGDLADRLIVALKAAERAGGMQTSVRSAALLVVRAGAGKGTSTDHMIDLRIDDDSLPLASLERLYILWSESYLLDARFQSVDEFNRQKKFAAAQAELKRIADLLNQELRRKPDDPDVLNGVALKLATYDIDRDRALELAKRAVTLAPGRSDYLNTMAECHYRLGHFDEAVAIEAELVNKYPTNDLYWKQLQKFKDAKSNR